MIRKAYDLTIKKTGNKRTFAYPRAHVENGILYDSEKNFPFFCAQMLLDNKISQEVILKNHLDFLMYAIHVDFENEYYSCKSREYDDPGHSTLPQGKYFQRCHGCGRMYYSDEPNENYCGC